MTEQPSITNNASSHASTSHPGKPGESEPLWLTLANASNDPLTPVTVEALRESLYADMLSDIENIDFNRVNRAEPSSTCLSCFVRR